jgi:hypothetical protein
MPWRPCCFHFPGLLVLRRWLALRLEMLWGAAWVRVLVWVLVWVVHVLVLVWVVHVLVLVWVVHVLVLVRVWRVLVLQVLGSLLLCCNHHSLRSQGSVH